MYTRQGDDIHHTVEITLKEALCGWRRTVQTIDGKLLSIESAGPTRTKWDERFPDLGMPRSRKPQQRGDFVISFTIKQPKALSKEQKDAIANALKDVAYED